MRHIVAVLLAILLCTVTASATDMEQYYYGEQPPSSNLNMGSKNANLSIGQLIWDFVGRNNTNGFFTNLIVTNPTGLYLQVAPPNLQNGSLYQILPALATPLGAGGLFPTLATPLSADPSQIFKQGIIQSPLPIIGPMSVPRVAGQSIIYLIECQVSETDSTPISTNFVSGTNVAGTSPIAQSRFDGIVCQAKNGVASATPVAPSPDANWLAIATATINSGATSIGSIVGNLPFNGFLQAVSSTSFFDLTTSNQTVTAPKNFSQAISMTQGAAILFNGASAGNLYGASIGSDGATNPGLLINVATGSSGVQFLTNLLQNGASVTAAGVFKAGNSQYGPTSAVVAGNLTATNFLGTSATLGGTVLANSGTAVSTITPTLLSFAPTSTASPVVAFDAAGDLGLGGGLSTSGGGLYGVNAYIPGTLTAASIAAGQCLTTNGLHQIVAAGGSCGLTQGTITSISSANSNLGIAMSNGAVTLTPSQSPTWSSATVGSGATAGLLNFGTDGLYQLNRSGNAFNLAYGTSTPPTLRADNGFYAGSSFYGPASASTTGQMAVGSLASSGVVSGTTGAFTGGVSGTSGTFSQGVSGTTGSFSGPVYANGSTLTGAGLTAAAGNQLNLISPAGGVLVNYGSGTASGMAIYNGGGGYGPFTANTVYGASSVTSGGTITSNSGGFNAPYVNGSISLGNGAGGSNGFVSSGGGASALYLNYFSGGGGVDFCNGATVCAANVTSAGQLNASSIRSNGAYVAQAGDIGAARTSNTGAYFFGTAGNQYLFFDGNQYNFGAAASPVTAGSFRSNQFQAVGGQAMILTDGVSTYLQGVGGGANLIWRNNGGGQIGFWGSNGYIYPDNSDYYGPSASNSGGFSTGGPISGGNITASGTLTSAATTTSGQVIGGSVVSRGTVSGSTVNGNSFSPGLNGGAGTGFLGWNHTGGQGEVDIATGYNPGSISVEFIRWNGSSYSLLSSIDSSGNYAVASDRRLKTNIRYTHSGLAQVMALKPASYTLRKTHKHDIGFIAQDVMKVIPDAVMLDKKDNQYMLKVDKLIPALVSAVQEQQREIKGLRAELAKR